MKLFFYSFLLLIAFSSCVQRDPNECKRIYIDYENAILLWGKKEVPKLEYVAFIGDFDTISIKVKGKNVKKYPVYIKTHKADDYVINICSVHSLDNDIEFIFCNGKQAVKKIWSMEYWFIDETIKKGNGKTIVFSLDDCVFLYPYDYRKNKQNASFEKRREKEREKDKLF